MLETIFISQRFFSKEETDAFNKKHGYDISEISYSSAEGEIDFSDSNEKSFLLENGVPKILARFGV